MTWITDDSLILLVSVLLPVCMAFLMIWPKLRGRILDLAPLAPLPALVLALFGSAGIGFSAPWLFKHTLLVMDDTARIFLGFTSVLYIVSAWQARGYMKGDAHRFRFFAFLLACMSGNLGVILAADIPSFYLSFAVMGLASAGLVFHRGDAESFRAGRIYLVLAMLGEAVLFAGLALLATRAGTMVMGEAIQSEHTTLTLVLITVGFGIKAGFLTLHFWLPLAHPAAPVPASAVLSGSMIKAGLLGWFRFLPLGQEAATSTGLVWIGLGLFAAFFSAAVGACRRNPKTVLAYSSISQMGIMMAGIGTGFMRPDAWPMILAALLVYAAHHGLAKGALFLGVSVAQGAGGRLAVFGARLGLLLPALALAGAPFTSGALAKVALKENLTVLPEPWAGVVGLVLPLAAAGTTLLMVRFLLIAWPRTGQVPKTDAATQWLPWGVAVAASLFGVWLLPGAMDWLLIKLTPAMLWKSFWPVLLGGLLAWLLYRRPRGEPIASDSPNEPGGLAAWFDQGIAFFERLMQPKERTHDERRAQGKAWVRSGFPLVRDYLEKAESRLRKWSVAGALLALISAILLILLL